MTPIRFLFGLLLFGFALPASAGDLKLPALFSDGMVLQRDVPTRFWGEAAPRMPVTLSSASGEASGASNREGRWEMLFPAQPAGGPVSLTIRAGDETRILNDVYFGDVWVASGQSNMEWRLQSKVDNWEREIADSDYPSIRFFEVPRYYSPEPQERLAGQPIWMIASPETAGEFSAVAWFFAKHNHLEKEVPVGVIVSAWGGTPAEAWTPASSVRPLPFYRSTAEAALTDPDGWRQRIVRNEQNHDRKWQLIQDTAAALATGAQAPAFADDSWSEVTIPNEAPLSHIVWLRKRFDLASVPVDSAVFELGALSQTAMFFLNGHFVHIREAADPLEPVPIDPRLFRVGSNLLAMRVINDWDNKVRVGRKGSVRLTLDTAHIPLEGTWKYSNNIEPKIPEVEPLHWNPGFLYNAMIHPLAGYTLKGFIWYQGESNVGMWSHYERLFGTMIDAWRIAWRQGELPFLFTQLANFQARRDQPGDSAWAALREAQRQTLQKPETGMAVTIDIGEANDIHPRNKQDVGQRLWLAARAVAFDEALIASGPVIDRHTLEDDHIVLRFTPTGGGLAAGENGVVMGFSVVDAEGKQHWADARIAGESVVVDLPSYAARPVELRYAWADNPACNLTNTAGLPASPFRISL